MKKVRSFTLYLLPCWQQTVEFLGRCCRPQHRNSSSCLNGVPSTPFPQQILSLEITWKIKWLKNTKSFVLKIKFKSFHIGCSKNVNFVTSFQGGGTKVKLRHKADLAAAALSLEPVVKDSSATQLETVFKIGDAPAAGISSAHRHSIFNWVFATNFAGFNLDVGQI